jgi:hypothetical protein
MHARTTLFEIDTLRISLEDGLALFRESVLPELRQQAGCLGVFVLDTPDGKGMLMSLWESAEAASRSFNTGFYDEQVAKFLTFLRQPPGRELYEVVYWELAETAAAAGGARGAVSQ